ncbi:uncharacterized protein NPIL_93941 [Nephila pilipes]|uniref:Coiled-coil domain-containing protein 137 n=1 Tax=Nephila pilipes TaxID=299642 RepID=A0A8X6P2P2_NEPPI|nr:uncharacterized protein NPIL_93941 [Nephila pilipes]
MGKRIPKSKKHKKLKFVDPCYKGSAPKLIKRNLLPNQPPRDVDDQQISRQLEKIIELKNKGKLKRRKRKKVPKDDFIIVKNSIVDTEEPGMERQIKKLPAVVKQKRFESEYQFIGRIQRMTNMAIEEANMEQKYDVEVKDVDGKGNVELVSAPKEVSERKREKRKMLAERKKEKKKLKSDEKEFDLKKERVSFGEVASAPPVLTAKLRKAPEFNKAGKRELILKNMLPSKTEPKEEKVTPLSKKWKNMQPEQKKALENERLRVVQLYRTMKSKKAS